MIMGMTGFGRAQAKYKNIELSVQIRSVNHRFFEVVCHMPERLLFLEHKIKQYLHGRLKRGRISFNLFLAGNLSGEVKLDKDLAGQYAASLRLLQKELRLKDELSVTAISAFPGVFNLAEKQFSEETIWPRIEKLLNSAGNNLLTMRAKEGRVICSDVLLRARKITGNISLIKKRLSVIIGEKRKKLKKSANNIEEISAIIKNCDISEEITRLGFHVKVFSEKVKSKKSQGPIGKELDFIAQEMQREANTMGAKSQDAFLSSAVIEIKSQIEKIREQLQNAE
ncbi:MAG: YicC family protein [Candidatus Omnitrophica bacterium CG11_big_fil_rev_8_21_14_0_20_42_13]|uniref:YicC family protein n=1 Tax=Candidatus Ghiorseimicrobium undicola TaxID=1974746 RepID=A0A2H0LZU4_9BACT|nr:MAG: YicC family protein [Candidatus Omnitrophica bacterium CG11_big_fil_rev_8_21_14_0_20_42_13]